MPKPECQHPSPNHSADRLAVWHGNTTPTILCGFHEQQGLNNALIEIRKVAK